MKPDKTLVKDLNDRVGPHSIRLKVIDKGKAQTSPYGKSLNYQRIVFQDEEGGKIRTTLYNNDITAFENIIHNKMEYDISNAKIKLMPEKYRGSADEHPYQLSFGSDTIIRPVEGCKPPTGPEYMAIDSIPRTITVNDRYDVVAILIYVEPVRQVPRPNGQILDVREIVVMDHSTSQPLIITAWAELATTEGEQLKELAESFPVIGFTSLKSSYKRGFSLATTTSTFVKLKPEGDRVDMLRAWSETNKAAITVKYTQVLSARAPVTGRVTTTIKSLRLKKVADTLQEERHWLHVSIPEFDRKDVRFYLGCSQCGTSSNKDMEVIYTCSACKREAVSSVPRMTIGFEAIDETGSLMFTSFSTDSEKLLKKKVADLYKMDPQAKQDYLKDAESRIRAGSIYIQVGPASSLSRNGALKWVLKQLSLE